MPADADRNSGGGYLFSSFQPGTELDNTNNDKPTKVDGKGTGGAPIPEVPTIIEATGTAC